MDNGNIVNLAVNGIQRQPSDASGNAMWERGQHYEWAVYGNRAPSSPFFVQNNRAVYEAAVNIFFRTVGNKTCSLRMNGVGQLLQPSAAAQNANNAAIWTTISSPYPNSFYLLNGGQEGGATSGNTEVNSVKGLL